MPQRGLTEYDNGSKLDAVSFHGNNVNARVSLEREMFRLIERIPFNIKIEYDVQYSSYEDDSDTVYAGLDPDEYDDEDVDDEDEDDEDDLEDDDDLDDEDDLDYDDELDDDEDDEDVEDVEDVEVVDEGDDAGDGRDGDEAQDGVRSGA